MPAFVEAAAHIAPTIVLLLSVKTNLPALKATVVPDWLSRYKGATVVISNAANWTTIGLYKGMFGATVCSIDVKRTLSSKVDERKSAKEVIAIFNKV